MPKKIVGEPFGVSEILGYRKFLCIRGVLRISVGNFLSRFAEKLRRGPFSVWQSFEYGKNFFVRGITIFSQGVARFSVDCFMSHSTEIFVEEPFSVSLISGIEKFYAQEGYIAIFCRKFSVSQNRKISRGEPFCVSENFWYRKILWIRRVGRECHNFPSKICCLTVPKNFVGETFCLSENSWYRKILWIRGVEGGGVTIRNRKNIRHDRDSNPVPTASE